MISAATEEIMGPPAPEGRQARAGRPGSPWVKYLLVRALGAIAVMAFLVILTFLMVRLVPGDPARIILGVSATPEQVSQVRGQLGLDQPLGVQFVNYVAGIFRGDLGSSFRTSQPVSGMLLQRLPVTTTLAAAALGVVLIIGFPLGILVGYAQSRQKAKALTHSFTSATSVVGAVPEYLMGTLLIVIFALGLRVLPAQGGQTFAGYILPTLAIGLGSAAIFARLVRNETMSALGQEYIMTANSKRMSTLRLLSRHVLPNVVTSTLALGGLILVALLGGTVITENVFNIPGLGSEVVSAVLASDYPSIQGIILILGVIAAAINLTIDVALGIIDPRVVSGANA
jgi:peptide/nickel transport system permease protein